MRFSLSLSLAKSRTKPINNGLVWFGSTAALRRPTLNQTKSCFLYEAICSLGTKSIHSGPCSPLRSRSESFEILQSFSLDETVPHDPNNHKKYHRNFKLQSSTKFIKQTSDDSNTDDNDSDDSVKKTSDDGNKDDNDSDDSDSVSNSDSKSGSDSKDDSDGAEKKSEDEESSKKIAKVEGPRLRDLGGMKKVVEQLEDVIFSLRFPKLVKTLGGNPISGILLNGPPGCGKTKLAQAIANETGFSFYNVSAPNLCGRYVGSTENRMQELFAKAHKTAPSIVFIDEIDAIGSKRDDRMDVEMGTRVVMQLLTCMDESHKPAAAYHSDDDDDEEEKKENLKSGYVLVIGATNRPDALDPALRRPGRFELEIVLNVPDENARVEILKVVTRNLRLEGPLDLTKIARSTSGYVGADLRALANRASEIARKRIMMERYPNLSIDSMNEDYKEDWVEQEKEKLTIAVADFERAAQEVQPSLKREGFSAIPNVKWEDVGGLEALRHEFNLHIVNRIKYPEIYEEFGVNLETGFLLYGPPGCGKTLIAKALANEAGANFIQIKGPELLKSYSGESVQRLFSRARACTPCILFFDEVDALTTKRGTVEEPVLNQLLVELDGGEQRKGVIVIGATNRPDVMDPAVLRPGRFGKHIYVPLPNKDERGFILKALARNKPIDSSVDLSEIGQRNACKNFTGADLAALMHEATMAAVQEKLMSITSSDASSCTITETHFKKALDKITPSLTEEDLQDYQKFGEQGRCIQLGF